MASINTRTRADGSTAYRVQFRVDGRLVGETFDTIEAAEEFVGWVDRFGGRDARQLRVARSGNGMATPTVAEWCREHVRGLSGITEGTRKRYYSMIDQQIAPRRLGQLPVNVPTRSHVAEWIQEQERVGDSDKTILNRHGLLYAAMDTATSESLRSGENPCKRSRIANTRRAAEPVFLTHNEFTIVLTHMPEWWKPLTVALAGSGARFSEVTALMVHHAHFDDDPPNLLIEQAWKYIDGKNRELGAPKTRRGRRTVSLAPNVVEVLRPLVEGREAYEWLFTKPGGGPVRNVDYREDGWVKALAKAKTKTRDDGTEIPTAERLTKHPRIHDLRHTHASWLIAAGVHSPRSRAGSATIRSRLRPIRTGT